MGVVSQRRSALSQAFYGNAIVPQVAQTFIESFCDALTPTPIVLG